MLFTATQLKLILCLCYISAVASATTIFHRKEHDSHRQYAAQAVIFRQLQQHAEASSTNIPLEGESTLSSRLWPVPLGYMRLYRRTLRVVGRSMVQQRISMEATWRSYIEQLDAANQVGACTLRFETYIDNPSFTAGLQDLESVDEQAVVYVRAANESALAKLSPAALTHSYVVIEAQLRKAGVNGTILTLSDHPDPSPEIVAAQLAAGHIVHVTPSTNLTVTADTYLQVNGPNGTIISGSIDVQTAFLLGFWDAQAQARLAAPILAVNVTNWTPNKASPGVSIPVNLATAIDFYYQYDGQLDAIQPALLWSQIGPLLPNATAAHRYQISAIFVGASRTLTTANGSAVAVNSLTTDLPSATTRRHVAAMAVPGALVAVAAIAAVVGAALLASLLVYGHRVLSRRQRLRQKDPDAVSDTSAAACLECGGEGVSSRHSGGGRPEGDAVWVDDGAGGAWVTFDTGADGKRILIGRGATATVYLGRRPGGQEVALKVLGMPAASGRAALQGRLQRATLGLMREVDMLRSVSRDANVVQFYGASLQPAANAVLVMEYCAGGNLRRLLSDPLRGPPLLWHGGGRHIALDAARGLAFLHSCGVVHRDVKSSNILLDGSGRAKVADVGLARHLHTVDMGIHTPAGTFVYLPPEVLLGTNFTGEEAVAAAKAADCYAFGVVLWELVTGELPVRAKMRGVITGTECCEAAAAIIEACLSADVAQRPTATQLVQQLEQLQGTTASSQEWPVMRAAAAG